MEHEKVKSTIGSQSSSDSGCRPYRAWYWKFIDKLETIEMLPWNWDGEGAVSPSRRTLNIAKSVLEIAHELEIPPKSVQPIPDSGIVMTFLKGTKHADLEICKDGDAVVLMEDLRDRKETIFELSSCADEIREALNTIRDYLVTL